MRAEFLEQSDLSVGGPEGDEILTQELDADRRAIRRGQLPGQQRRHPIAAHGLAHRGPGADPGQTLVILFRKHGSSGSGGCPRPCAGTREKGYERPPGKSNGARLLGPARRPSGRTGQNP